MKKVLVTALSLGVFAWAGSAMAAPMTWVDEINFNPDIFVGWYGSYDYTHDINDNGFSVLSDTVDEYTLTIALYDDGGFFDLGEIAHINQPGLLGDGLYDWSYTNNSFGWSLAGRYSLNSTGMLDVTISSWFGDFYIDASTLTASGSSNPVPEPATMLLFGAGLAGLAAVGRRRKTE